MTPGFLQTSSICPSLCLWFPHASKNPPLCPYLRKIKSHAWTTGGPLLWHPSSASVLRSSSETTSALCCLPRWTHYNLHTAENCSTDDAIAFTLHTALSHLENKNTYVRMLFVDYSSAFNTIVLPHWLRSSRLWDWTDLCAAGSWTSWQQKSGGQNGQQHFISADPQHWCSAGLRSQPTLYSLYTHDCTATHSSNVIVNLPMTQRW